MVYQYGWRMKQLLALEDAMQILSETNAMYLTAV